MAVVVGNRACNSSCSTNGVTSASRKGEDNGFIRFDLGISCRINRDGGSARTCREGHHLCRRCRGNACVISAQGSGAANGVVDRQSRCSRPCACEGIDEVGGAVFCNSSRRDCQGDRGEVVVGDRANNGGCGADDVAVAGREGEGSGFVGFRRRVWRWIDGDVCCGGTSREGDSLCGPR